MTKPLFVALRRKTETERPDAAAEIDRMNEQARDGHVRHRPAAWPGGVGDQRDRHENEQDDRVAETEKREWLGERHAEFRSDEATAPEQDKKKRNRGCCQIGALLFHEASCGWRTKNWQGRWIMGGSDKVVRTG